MFQSNNKDMTEYFVYHYLVLWFFVGIVLYIANLSCSHYSCQVTCALWPLLSWLLLCSSSTGL